VWRSSCGDGCVQGDALAGNESRAYESLNSLPLALQFAEALYVALRGRREAIEVRATLIADLPAEKVGSLVGLLSAEAQTLHAATLAFGGLDRVPLQATGLTSHNITIDSPPHVRRSQSTGSTPCFSDEDCALVARTGGTN
jgi:hypothetical protein